MRLVQVLILLFISSTWAVIAQDPTNSRPSAAQPGEVLIGHDILALDQRPGFILLDMLRGTGLHGGAVEIADCSYLAKASLQIKKGATVQQALDAFVGANPEYRWELKGGAVNLIPRTPTPVLQTRIAQFQRNATDREIAALLQELMRLPEAQKAETAHRAIPAVGQETIGGSSNPNAIPKPPLQIRIDLRDLTLQDAFNKVVAFSPDGVWIYRENTCSGTTTYAIEMFSSSN